MLTNIDINKMNHLLETNEDARQIITRLLKNHQEAVSLISHEIRNPLTLISSSLQIMELEHPEVKEFSNWKQTMDDVDFMCSLLNELSDYNNGNTLHLSVFSIEQLLKISQSPLQSHLNQNNLLIPLNLPPASCLIWEVSPVTRLNWKKLF